MGLGDTISMAAGFCVGAGVITLTGIAIGLTGRSVVLSYVLTALTFLVAVLPALIMCIVYPRRSGYYVYSKELLHPRVAGIYQCSYFLGRLTISMFGISFAEYLAYLIPGLDQKMCAILVLTLFYIINLMGTKAAAKVQTVLFYILVAGMVCYIGVGMTKVDLGAYFTNAGAFENDAPFFVNGFSGVWQAASLLVFAVGGCGVLVDFGDQIDNPSKNIPKVAIGVTLGVCLAYALLSMVSAGLLPYSEVAYKPLTNAAAAVFGKGSFMFAVFIIGTALMALVTTLNSSFQWYSNAMMRSCQDGWFPKAMAKTNRFGAPYIMMTVWYLFGLLPVLLDMPLNDISRMAVAMTIITWAIPTFALVNMPKRMPEAWNTSRFARMPRWSLWVICTLSFVIYVTQAISNLSNVNTTFKIVIVVYMVAAVAYCMLRKDYPGKELVQKK